MRVWGVKRNEPFLLTINSKGRRFLLIFYRRCPISDPRLDVLQGTLDLMILKTLETMGSLHGYGIARRLEQISRDMMKLNQGTVYPALLRLEQRDWIGSKWGVSDNNRRAKYYSITRAGQRQLAAETENWELLTGIMARLLSATEES
ncbi:MAG: PadR family transcriptional regulator [Candidatus Acidiferrales bacterium]